MEAKFKIENRKELVEAIARIAESKPKYLGAPSMAYQVAEFTIAKDGTVTGEDNDMKALIAGLALEGIKCDSGLRTHSIGMPILPPEAMTNLVNMIAAKAELLKQALKTDELPVITDYEEQKIYFPWFREMGPEEADAYTLLITKMVEVAKSRKRINAKPHETENAKYSFRCFLLGLGFIGDEYKGARKILLANLEGNAAFKGGAK